ncbi:hypothetical protein F0562_029613 [Nyssa sinensis]|uniref:DUF4283 domain-containing protein n=1 Tax=Nyssa sinensis TaxID=561372 RepID=A0A5J5B7M8_9ASTE|nr:hypothetical protein F0562_029613 [Nyssa sinensis]
MGNLQSSVPETKKIQKWAEKHWGVVTGLRVFDMHGVWFLSELPSQATAQRILDGKEWTFEGQEICLKRWLAAGCSDRIGESKEARILIRTRMDQVSATVKISLGPWQFEVPNWAEWGPQFGHENYNKEGRRTTMTVEGGTLGMSGAHVRQAHESGMHKPGGRCHIMAKFSNFERVKRDGWTHGGFNSRPTWGKKNHGPGLEASRYSRMGPAQISKNSMPKLKRAVVQDVRHILTSQAQDEGAQLELLAGTEVHSR